MYSSTLLATSCTLVFACALQAQVITGRVRTADESARTVAGARVALSGDTTVSAVTDAHGRFSLPVPAGHFQLTTEAFNFAPTTSDWLEIKSKERLVVDVRIHPDAGMLAPLVVKARMAIKPGHDGFADRMERGRKSGQGRFITEDEIAGSLATYLSDALRFIPHNRASVPTPTRTSRGPTTFSSRPLSTQRAGTCDGPVYYVDGARTRLTPVEIDAFIPLSNIHGVEIYNSAAEAPGQFGAGNCQVIVIWSK